MSGVMIKVALYGLIRVLFEWAAPAPAVGGSGGPRRSGCCRRSAGSSTRSSSTTSSGCSPSTRSRTSGSSRSASAPRSSSRPRATPPGRRSPSPPRSCTCSTTRCSRRCCSSRAGAFERAVGSLDLDRLGGLLRRMPWTGGAFLVGSMAIAGVPPLNGFASEWLTLQALVHLAIDPPLGLGLAGAARGGRPCGDRGARPLLLRQGGRAGPAGRAAAPGGRGGGRGAAGHAGGDGRPRRLLRRARRRPRPAVPTLMELAPQPAEPGRRPGLAIPGTGSLPSPWLAARAARA